MEEHIHAFYTVGGLSLAFAGVIIAYAFRRSGLHHVCSRIRNFLPTPWSLSGYARFAGCRNCQMASRYLTENRGYPSFLYVVRQQTIGCDTSMT